MRKLLVRTLLEVEERRGKKKGGVWKRKMYCKRVSKVGKGRGEEGNAREGKKGKREGGYDRRGKDGRV
jgi:hypothetical protein